MIIFRDDNRRHTGHRCNEFIVSFSPPPPFLRWKEASFWWIFAFREVDKLPIVCHSYVLNIRRTFYLLFTETDEILRNYSFDFHFLTSVDNRVKIRMCNGFVLRSVVSRYVLTLYCVQYTKRNRQRPVTSDNCAKELLNELFIERNRVSRPVGLTVLARPNALDFGLLWLLFK